MRDVAARTIHDVGLSLLAHLDLRDDIPDELEIDLCNGDAGIATVPGQCEGHVWFEIRSEGKWGRNRSPGDGLEEFQSFEASI